VRRFLPLLLALACQGGSTVPGQLDMTGETYLTIDGKPISKDFVDVITAPVPKKQLEMMKQSGQLREYIEQMAVYQVLYERALADKLQDDPKTRMRIAVAERDAMAKDYVERQVTASITDEKLKATYDERAVQYQKKQVKSRHILVQDEATANEVLGLLKAGGDFAAIAKEKSTDKGSGAKGGDLGWMGEGQLDKAFSDAAFAANANDLVGPIQTRFGWHVIQVQDKRDAVPLEEVRDQLEQMLKQDAYKKLIEEVKGAAKIEWKVDPATGQPGQPAEPTKPAMPPGLQMSPGGAKPSLQLGPPGAKPPAAPVAPAAPAAPAAPPAPPK
jgi:peptidyl-prolyl cis-trans isomerase C